MGNFVADRVSAGWRMGSQGQVEFSKEEQNAHSERAEAVQSARVGDHPCLERVHTLRDGIGNPVLFIATVPTAVPIHTKIHEEPMFSP